MCFLRTEKLKVLNNKTNKNCDDVTKQNMKYHDLNWLRISDHPCKIIII